MRRAEPFWVVCLIVALLGGPAFPGVVGSKHDLTYVAGVAGPGHGTNYFNNYGEVCVYCHTAHGASSLAPLWNRVTPSQPYVTYASATMDTAPGQPSAYSLTCLSCHDGTIAVDAIINAPGSGANLAGPWYGNTPSGSHFRMASSGAGACGNCHQPAMWGHDGSGAYLGTDLSDDHPIAMNYPTAAQDPAFNPPPDPQTGWGGGSAHDVKLYAGRLECPTCHNVHDPAYAPFLRKSNLGSALCLTCHIK